MPRRKEELEAFVRGIPGKAFYRDLVVFSVEEMTNGPFVTFRLSASVNLTLITKIKSASNEERPTEPTKTYRMPLTYVREFVDQTAYHEPIMAEKLQSVEAERMDMAFRSRIYTKMDELKKMKPIESLDCITLSKPMENYAKVSRSQDQKSASLP